MKNNKGIPLIALVVTIIVLLILAGVSIAMLTGQNGILNRASDAGESTAVSSAKEKVTLAINEAITDYYNDNYTGSGATSTTLYTAQRNALIALNNKEESGAKITVTPSTELEASGTPTTVTVTISYKNQDKATGTLSKGEATDAKWTFSWNTNS